MEHGGSPHSSSPPPGAARLYGGSGGGTAAPAPRPDPRPPARRLLLPALLLGAAALVGLLVLSLHGGSAGGALSPIAEAAQKTGSIDGVRFTGTGVVEASGVELRMSFRGARNARSDRTRIEMDFTVPAQPQLGSMIGPMVGIQEGPVMYLSMPPGAGALPAGKRWMKVDLSEVVGDEAPDGLERVDPQAVLAELESLGDDARRVGAERIRGARTVHYTATIDPRRQAERLREDGNETAAELVEREWRATRADVWVDRRGFVRRTSLVIPFELVGGPGAAMSMTMDFRGFGADPEIHLPPEGLTYDATELSLAALDEALAAD